MRRVSIVAVISLCVLAVAGQFVAPRVAASDAENRLTKDGGSAHADISAFPWPRLLFTEGDSVKVRARGISLALLSPTSTGLKQLDGFDDVDVRIIAASAGPFRLQEVG